MNLCERPVLLDERCCCRQRHKHGMCPSPSVRPLSVKFITGEVGVCFPTVRCVKQQAVRALGKIRDKRAVRALISAQKDDVVEVRREAAEALGRIGRVDSIEPLTRALRKDEALEVRSQAAEALGEIGDTRAVLSLITALGDTESQVRECVAKVLGKMGDSQAIEPLTNLFEHETHGKVKKAAADALHRLKDARGFD